MRAKLKGDESTQEFSLDCRLPQLKKNARNFPGLLIHRRRFVLANKKFEFVSSRRPRVSIHTLCVSAGLLDLL